MQALNRIILLWVLSMSFFVASAQQTKFDYIFQEAMRQKLANKYDAAIDLFDYCRQLDPYSGAVLYELSELYRYVKNDSLAIQSLEFACKLYPENYWYKNKLVSFYLEQRRTDEALKNVEDMARLFPEKGEVLGMLLELYENKNDYANMVKVLDKIEVKEGKSEQLSMEKFRLFLQMNDEKRAFEEMENLADEYPNDLRYQVVIGDLYLDAGKKEEALKQYKMVEAQDSTNMTLLLSMANFYHQEGDEVRYQEYISKVLTNKDVDDATRGRMLGVLVRENLTTNADSTQLLSLFDKVLQEPQEHADILELKVRYMVTKNMPISEVKPVLHQMLDIDPENDMASSMSANLLSIIMPKTPSSTTIWVWHTSRCKRKRRLPRLSVQDLTMWKTATTKTSCNSASICMPFSVTSTISSDKTIRHFRHTTPAWSIRRTMQWCSTTTPTISPSRRKTFSEPRR